MSLLFKTLQIIECNTTNFDNILDESDLVHNYNKKNMEGKYLIKNEICIIKICLDSNNIQLLYEILQHVKKFCNSLGR